MKAATSTSLFWLRLRKFRRLKRGYYSFVILVSAYLISFLLPFLINNRAILVRYEGQYYFPSLRTYSNDTFGFGTKYVHLAKVFGQTEVNGEINFGETDYRALQKQFAAAKAGDYVIMPFFPYSPTEQFFDLEGSPPHPPSWLHWLGTDDRDRDVLARLAYGFRISISFALLVIVFAYFFGTVTGATLGYFGGRVDIVGQRLVEIWSSVPFLYTVIILSSMLHPSFWLLVAILAIFGWMGIAAYIRGEFYREKSKDYVAAALAIGESNRSIIFRHILPNSLTPIISYAPFAIVGEISTLVALDFLGFGLPAPTPSWGELIGQGKGNYSEWHLVVFPLLAIFFTLQLIVFIGEAVREAFDPKVYSRLN